MAPIPFPLSSSPGTRAMESRGRLVNLYAEPLGEGRGAKWVRAPGMTSFLTSSQTGFRGMIEVNGVLYAAFLNALYRGTSAGGAMTLHGTLTGADPVYFARNNAATPDLVVVTENGAFTISGASTISSYPDLDLPIPNSVFSLDGYLVFTIGDGRAFATDLNSTSVNALSFGQAEAKPDALVRGVNFAGRANFFGTETLEIWTNVGSSPFPFQRSVTIPFGLMAAGAVAGQEDGFGAALLFVAQDGSVRQLNGYTADKVSPPDLDRLIQAETSKSDLLACVYMVDGHPMWSIKGTNFTWVFDINTKKWHERVSYQDVHWRGRQTLRAFERWLVGDDETGNIYEIDPDNFKEGLNPLVYELESSPVEKFPNLFRVAQADFAMQMGVGIATGADPEQTDPTVEVSWTNDGGVNWSNPRLLKMGRQAISRNQVSTFNTGLTGRQGRRWRLRVSDAVYVSVFGGEQHHEMRRDSVLR
jgi:hypothetical protein